MQELYKLHYRGLLVLLEITKIAGMENLFQKGIDKSEQMCYNVNDGNYELA